METNDETEYLIADGSKKSEPKSKLNCLRRRTIVVEPLIVLFVAAGMPMMNIRSQFMYQRVGEAMGINTNNLTTNGSECNQTITDPNFIAKQHVQGQTADLNMYISLTSFIPSFIALMVYGALGDKIGRRMLLILPCLGSLYQVFLYMLIIKLELSPYFFFLEAGQTLFGGFEALMLGSFAIIADTIPTERLSFRMTILDVVGLANAGISSLVVGYWINAQGFFWPLVFVAAGKLLALLYAVFFIPETIHNNSSNNPTQPRKTISFKDMFSGFRLMYKDDGTGRRLKINLLLIAFTVGNIIMTSSIMTLFQMNNPLCWGPVLIGYFSSATMLIKCAAMLFAAGILKKYLHDKWLLVISKLSICVEYIFMVFVTNSVMMFIAPALGCISFLSIPMTRSLLSTHVGKTEQASVFSLIAISYSFCNLVSSIATNKIYAASLMFWETLVFLVDAIVNIISTAIVGYYVFKVTKEQANRITGNVQE